MPKEPVSAAGVREGDLIAGKYRIDKVLGAGAMGVVVAAHHIHLDEKVAIKFLLPETLENRDAVMRFGREARAAVKIKSEHVARVADVGTLENGAPYMVMEFLEGGDLSQWLEQRGPLPVEQAVQFILQACEALAEAHALGIVHRDLKPANLFVVRRADGVESVKVLDFGISKVTGFSASHPDSSMTRTTAIMGSPLYMSPEQMQSSKDVDTRGDIWALGIILYELVTGVSPFVAETLPELVAKILSTHPTPLRNLRPDLPPGLEPVLWKCLEKNRNDRYQNVGQLALALLPFGSKRARNSVDRIAGVMRSSGLSGADFAPNATLSPDAVHAGAISAFVRTATGHSRGRVATVVGVLAAGGVAGVIYLSTMRTGTGDIAVEPMPGSSGARSEPGSAPPEPAPKAAAEAPPPAAQAAPTASVVVTPAGSASNSPPPDTALPPVPAKKSGPRPRPAAAPPAPKAPATPEAPAAPARKGNIFDDRE